MLPAGWRSGASRCKQAIGLHALHDPTHHPLQAMRQRGNRGIGTGLGERFAVSELFFLDDPAELEPLRERSREFRHFGWREFVRRFDGPGIVPVGVAGVLLLIAVVCLVRGLDRTAYE